MKLLLKRFLLSSNVIRFFSIEAEVRTTQNKRLGHRQIVLDREDAIVDHLSMVICGEDKTTQSMLLPSPPLHP